MERSGGFYELPLASASGERTALAKALWKEAFSEFWLKPLLLESLAPLAQASGNSTLDIHAVN